MSLFALLLFFSLSQISPSSPCDIAAINGSPIDIVLENLYINALSESL